MVRRLEISDQGVQHHRLRSVFGDQVSDQHCTTAAAATACTNRTESRANEQHALQDFVEPFDRCDLLRTQGGHYASVLGRPGINELRCDLSTSVIRARLPCHQLLSVVALSALPGRAGGLAAAVESAVCDRLNSARGAVR